MSYLRSSQDIFALLSLVLETAIAQPVNKFYLIKNFRDLNQHNVYNSRKTHMKLKGFEFQWALFLPVYKFSILNIKLKYSAFMLFDLLLFHFKSKLGNNDAFMYIYTFRKKNCKETLRLQKWQCIFSLLHLHICKLSFIQQTLLEMKKNIFNFSDACPLGCKSYFDLFLKKSKHGCHVLTSFLFYIALSNKWSIDSEKCKVSTPSA